jgi:hypothetical protein
MEVSGQLHAPAACAWGRKNFGFHWMHPGWPEHENNSKYQPQAQTCLGRTGRTFVVVRLWFKQRHSQ